MLGTYGPPEMIALAAELEQTARDLERADARVAELEEKNAFLQRALDASASSESEAVLHVRALEERVAQLQLSSMEIRELKDDRVVRAALEKEMQRLHKQIRPRTRSSWTKSKAEVTRMEDALQSMESANRAALNSKELALGIAQARVQVLEADMEVKTEKWEDEGAMQRAQVQTLQRQLGTSLHEVDWLKETLAHVKQRYKSDHRLWLDCVNLVMEAVPASRAAHEQSRPATA